VEGLAAADVFKIVYNVVNFYGDKVSRDDHNGPWN
jgi:hypothetical protein